MTFVKDESQKLRPSLLPSDSLMEVVKVLEFGAKKYAKDNWKLCDDHSRYLDATLRHLYAHSGGEYTDAESGLPHLAHAACNLLFLLHFKQTSELDRPGYKKLIQTSLTVSPGDFVLLVDASDNSILVKGNEYQVDRVRADHMGVLWYVIGGVEFNASRFRKVKK